MNYPFKPMRFLACAFLVLLVSSCASRPSERPSAKILVVDSRGTPIPGAIILFVDSDERRQRTERLSDEEVAERTSDLQGLIRAELDPGYWDTDGSYHFRIHRAGYEDVEMAVSKELFPPLLKITLDPRVPQAEAPKQAQTPAGAQGR